MQTFGYTGDHDEGIPVIAEVEGMTGDRRFYKLKAGQIEKGMSGAPLLNLRTGAVCAVLRTTRDRGQALGGYAIPVTSLYKLSDTIETSNHVFHSGRAEWIDLLPETTRRTWRAGQRKQEQAALPAQVIVITVAQRKHHWEVRADLSQGATIGPERVDLNTVRMQVARLFRDWASPDSAWRGRVNRDEEAQLLGTILWTAILPGKIGKKVEQLIAKRPKAWVQIALRFTYQTHPDLEYLPWEHLYLPKAGDRGESYLAREPNFAFTRTRAAKSRPQRWLPATDLKVLLVSSLPPPVLATDRSDAAAAQRSMCDAVTTVATKARALLEGLEGVTPVPVEPDTASQLANLVKSNEPAIVQYVGYGRFEDGADEIALGQAAGQPNYIGASTFAGLLDAPAPCVVVLQLCDAEPRMPGFRADMAPFAPEVLARGVEALVGFQYPTFSADGICFNKNFYTRLVAGVAVELAVQESREALWLENPDSRTFLAPTVTVRGPGGLRLLTKRAQSSAGTYVGAAAGYG